MHPMAVTFSLSKFIAAGLFARLGFQFGRIGGRLHERSCDGRAAEPNRVNNNRLARVFSSPRGFISMLSNIFSTQLSKRFNVK